MKKEGAAAIPAATARNPSAAERPGEWRWTFAADHGAMDGKKGKTPENDG